MKGVYMAERGGQFLGAAMDGKKLHRRGTGLSGEEVLRQEKVYRAQENLSEALGITSAEVGQMIGNLVQEITAKDLPNEIVERCSREIGTLLLNCIRQNMGPHVKKAAESFIAEFTKRQLDALSEDIEAKIRAEVVAQWEPAVERAVRSLVDGSISAVRSKILGGG